MHIIRVALAAALAALPVAASAHGEAHRPSNAPAAQPMVETGFGRTGDPKRAGRTVRVDMSDRMRFSPDAIEVRQGDTVRFVVRNSGKVMHEMVLGTMDELKAHAELMKRHPGMEHDEPYMAHVEPGRTAEIVWQFTKAGEYYYGCLIPGHFEAGMVGRVKVVAK
jgi:uncharacterized cupredoxin-like copper-binding protein